MGAYHVGECQHGGRPIQIAAKSRLSAQLSGVLTSARRRLIFGITVLVLMMLLCAPLFIDAIRRDAPRAHDGALSYAAWGPLDAPVELKGDWRLHWLSGSGVTPGTTASVSIPAGWAGARTADGRRLPPQGAARFELTLTGLQPGRYILHVPLIFGANRVWIDGRMVGAFGHIGRDAQTTRYYVRSHEIPFETDGSPIILWIDVGAYLHRDTGLVDPPVLGRSAAMRSWIAVQWAKDFLFQTSLLLLAAMTLVGFFYRPRDRASLYIALTAIAAIPGSAIISYDNILLLAVPNLPYDAMLMLQYLSSNVAILTFASYARTLFPSQFPRRLYQLIVAALAALSLAEIAGYILSGPRAASVVAVAWPLVLLLAFGSMIAVVARAAWRQLDGAAIFLFGIVVFAVLMTNAALVWSGLVTPDFLFGTSAVSVGMLILLFSHFVLVAERWTLALVAAERSSEELRELLEVSSAVVSEVHLDALLARIVEVTSRMLDADRCTLLLYDGKTGELWSLIAEGMGSRQIRLPSTAGLAGHVFTTGTTLSIADAYGDPRFSRTVDEITGYRTRSVLAMPVIARDGERLGVLQALNCRNAEQFSQSDADRMAAFAAQSSIAIQNAQLFEEIVESRNYNESILRSMSNGVITLDNESGTGRLNAAAQRILGLIDAQAELEDVRTLLHAANPLLIAEIDAVAAAGLPRALYDLDARAGNGEMVALNVSIVPLQADGVGIGVLVLIEDISEGKRLQGAMRRFMTQEVVDHVMGQGDDLMFGSSCTASVLFADIRNFTTMAETLSARETVDMLNEAFTDFVEAVAAHSGVLDKFIGDAIMAVFGAPISSGQDPLNAVTSGMQMLRMLALLNRRRTERSMPTLRLGIGIATGEVVAGTIGSPKRMDYTVIGDSVNLAARLQDLTKIYGVEMLVCEQTAAKVGSRYRLRELDLILVRGRRRPAKIFEVLTKDGGEAIMSDALLDAYHRGRAALTNGSWNEAVAAFEEAAAIDPADAPAQLMLGRALALAAEPPAEHWDGVWRGHSEAKAKAA